MSFITIFKCFYSMNNKDYRNFSTTLSAKLNSKPEVRWICQQSITTQVSKLLFLVYLAIPHTSLLKIIGGLLINGKLRYYYYHSIPS